MFSIKSLFQAVRSWHRRRGGPKTPKRTAPVTVERLDHRQLLSANFTGNAVIDIPATGPPGTVILLDNGSAQQAGIPLDLKPIIKVSGLDISGVRMVYTPGDDILSIALQSPDNQKTGQPVLAGDTDNNGDGGTVAPDVLALRPGFVDFAFLGGTETMGAFLDLNGDNIPDVVAGIANNPGAGKLYQVSDAVVNPDPAVAATTRPLFGAKLLNNTGAAFLANDPGAPNFEFQVTNFSKLYQAKTGQPLRTNSVIKVGAFGASDSDDGISEAFFPAQNANFGVVPPLPPVCPPLEPPIKINPHENNHINTAHPTDVRVYIFGTARFNVNNIVPASVRLGGAAPIANFARHVDGDAFLDRTFVFRGSDITLPRGITNATVTGTLVDGTSFQSTARVFNRNDSYYTPQEIAERDARQSKAGFSSTNPPLTPFQQGQVGSLHDLALEQEANGQRTAFESTTRTTVKIATRATSTNQAPRATAAPMAPAHPMAASVGSSAARTATGSESPLMVNIPRRPITQSDASLTVQVPRRATVSSGEVHSARTRTRPLASVPTRSGWGRMAVGA